MPAAFHLFSSPDDGRPSVHHFQSGKYYLWSGALELYDPHPDVPHAMATVYDMATPKSESHILRSELLTVICLLKAQMRNIDLYLDHRVCPVCPLPFQYIYEVISSNSILMSLGALGSCYQLLQPLFGSNRPGALRQRAHYRPTLTPNEYAYRDRFARRATDGAVARLQANRRDSMACPPAFRRG